MIIKFTSDEKKLIKYAQKAIVKYNKMRHKKVAWTLYIPF